MRCFDQEHPWPDKVNYVDENNRVVGFDMNGRCCERYGHGVFLNPPESIEGCASDALGGANLKPYSFADGPPSVCVGGEGLAFRIFSNDHPSMWVVIWNVHNGYYSHGFTYWGGEGTL